MQKPHPCLAVNTLSFTPSACKKTSLSFLSALPIFVPSLCWQNDHFYLKTDKKCRFLTCIEAAQLSVERLVGANDLGFEEPFAPGQLAAPQPDSP
jgi:hypothetical protein